MLGVSIMNIEKILAKAVEEGASDILIIVGMVYFQKMNFDIFKF